MPSAFLKLACAFFQPQDFSLPAFSLCSYYPSSVHLSGTRLETVVSCVLIVSGPHLLPCPSPLQWCPCPVSLVVAWVTDVRHWCPNSSLLCFFPKPLLSSPYPVSTLQPKVFQKHKFDLVTSLLKTRQWLTMRQRLRVETSVLAWLRLPLLPGGALLACPWLFSPLAKDPLLFCPSHMGSTWGASFSLQPVPCLLNACLLCKFHTYGSSSAKPF